MSPKIIIFDWGDTLMRDFPEKHGPMCHWDIIEVIEGVPETLSELSKTFTLCVATNAGVSDTTLMRKALRRGNIEHFFTHFFSSKDLGYTKPDVHFFLSICQHTGVFPHECVFIGNDYYKDIVGAANARMYPIFFNHARWQGEAPAAKHIITKFIDIMHVIYSLK